MDTKSAFEIIKKVLAADFACRESDFDKEGVFVYEAKEMPGRRKFPFREKQLNIVTMGDGVVVSCSADRLEWARENLSKLKKDEIFSETATSRIAKYIAADGQVIKSPDLKYICIPARFLPYYTDADVKLAELSFEEIKHYFETQEFHHAIGNRDNPDKMQVIAVSAVCDGKIAGMAAAGADCDEMYQVGVSVLPEYRNRGVGRAVVGRVTEMLFDMGKLPYYSTWTSNIASRRLNISLGYFPAWIELYAMYEGELDD